MAPDPASSPRSAPSRSPPAAGVGGPRRSPGAPRATQPASACAAPPDRSPPSTRTGAPARANAGETTCDRSSTASATTASRDAAPSGSAVRREPAARFSATRLRAASPARCRSPRECEPRTHSAPRPIRSTALTRSGPILASTPGSILPSAEERRRSLRGLRQSDRNGQSVRARFRPCARGTQGPRVARSILTRRRRRGRDDVIRLQLVSDA